MIDAIVVVIPVHDEEELLPACLDAVDVAVRNVRPAVTARVWVVLDACSDDSLRIARSHDVHLVTVSERRVGAARTAGVTAALASIGGDEARIWTAHTDADSTVPAHWLTSQLELADAGADVILGTVRPDFRDLTAAQTAAWWSTRTPGIPVGVHGANLGVRASALRTAGGFRPLATREDIRLVDRLYETGASVVASDEAWVRTSGRLVGRTPDGFARYLREDLVVPAGLVTP